MYIEIFPFWAVYGTLAICSRSFHDSIIVYKLEVRDGNTQQVKILYI